MKKMSRDQLQIILMEEYINSHLDEDAVFTSHDIPGDTDAGHSDCGCASKKPVKNSAPRAEPTATNKIASTNKIIFSRPPFDGACSSTSAIVNSCYTTVSLNKNIQTISKNVSARHLLL